MPASAGGTAASQVGLAEGSGVIVIDYSSPNIAKRMHIGHLRSTIIGDSLKRIFRYLGYTVIGDNHLGDWGTQFGKLITAYRLWLDPEAYRNNPIEELERLYVKFEKESATEGDSGPLLEGARRELKKLQDGDPENRALWKEYVDLSLKEYETIYRRLGVSFDTYRGESYYHDRMAGVVRELVEKGLARRSEGALVVFFDEADKLTPCLVQKNDGAFLYATSDLACIQSRREEYALDRIIYVTDDRQIPHFQQVFKIAELSGWTEKKVHVPFGVMKFSEGHFSSRKGNVIYLSQLLDEAEKRALSIVTQKNPGLPEDEKAGIARAVGLGAVKYFDLSQNRSSDIIFDWDRILSFEGNTAPYLQYVYARIRSLSRKALEAAETDVSGPGVLPGNETTDNPIKETADDSVPPLPAEGINDTEQKLIHLLLQFPQAVHQAAENYRPNLLSDYIFDLSQVFNYFYNTFPILKARPELRTFRLFLCQRVAEIIKTGLDLLGIEVLERM
jgi:arginyl-tRNA synthetase